MNYRCNRCGRRRSPRRRLKRWPRCCGTEMRDDTKNVRAWNARQGRCECGLIPYPHRPGSSDNGTLCAEHPRANPWSREQRPCRSA